MVTTASPSDTELRARVRQQEVVADLGQRALSRGDLDRLMHEATVAVRHTLDADYCKVLELLPGGDEVLLRQGVGWRDGLVGTARVPTDRESQAGYTLLSEAPVVVDDLATEERFSGPDLLVDHDVTSGVSGVIGSVEEPWGVLGVHTIEQREFADHDVNFVRSVANVLASAIDNERTARRLRERERRLERYRAYTDDVLDAVDDIFYVLDEAGDLRRWNRSIPDVTGYAAAEIESMHALEFFGEDDQERIADAIAEAFETGSAQVEAAILTADGESIPYEFVASRLETPAGEPVLAGIGREVTDRKESQRRLEELVDRLEESNERLEQFAYAASHDLQEPLRMISSYLTLIERRYGDALDADGEEFLAFAVDGAERMREMIDGLLTYSRIDTRGDPFEPVDLDEILAEAIENLRVRIDETDAEVDAESLPTMYGDPGQLRQLFQNLLSNAITYTDDGPPEIRVAAERAGSRWRVAVSDRGIGIDPADVDRIFDVFDRLHAATEHEGTGIGLAICERIVERHGGEIDVDSEPGEGSTFSVTLPADRSAVTETGVEPTGVSDR